MPTETAPNQNVFLFWAGHYSSSIEYGLVNFMFIVNIINTK